MVRPGDRYKVEFKVKLQWQVGSQVRLISGTCRDISESGMRIETVDTLEARQTVLVSSEKFGRMGFATTRYVRREGMKYAVGLHFSIPIRLTNGPHKAELEAAIARAGNAAV